MENETTEQVEGGHAEALDLAGEAGHGESLGGEVLGVAEVAMPQLDFGLFPNLIFWLILAMIALYLVLTRVALPRVETIMAERNDAISNDLEQAAIYKRRAQEAEAAYAAALARAREDSQKIAAETKAQIGKELATLTAKADAEIAARSAESEKRIREIEASAAESVTEVARATAAEIVAAFGPRAADDETIAAAVSSRLGG